MLSMVHVASCSIFLTPPTSNTLLASQDCSSRQYLDTHRAEHLSGPCTPLAGQSAVLQLVDRLSCPSSLTSVDSWREMLPIGLTQLDGPFPSQPGGLCPFLFALRRWDTEGKVEREINHEGNKTLYQFSVCSTQNVPAWLKCLFFMCVFLKLKLLVD